MSKKYIFLFIISLVIIVNLALAQSVIDQTPLTNQTTITTTIFPITIDPNLEKLSETFYGEVRWADGDPVEAGYNITAKDQYGKIIGHYLIRELGQYGSSRPYGERMSVSIYRNQSDRETRDSVIFINFFVNDIRSRNMINFKVGEDEKFDILLPIVKPTPAPTTIPTPEPTSIETIITPVTTTNISVQTLITPTPPVSTTSTIIPGIEDSQLVIYGLILMGMIIIGMIGFALIQSYLMNKSSREDSLGPEDKWR